MSFPDAVSSCLRQYVKFSGRARRSEYWYFFLFQVLVGIAAGVLDAAAGTDMFSTVVGLGLLLPSLAVLWRRLHDMGRSGGWAFISLIPLIGAIVLLVFLCSDSEGGPVNRFGPNPKYTGALPGAAPTVGYPQFGTAPAAPYGSPATPQYGTATNPQYGATPDPQYPNPYATGPGQSGAPTP